MKKHLMILVLAVGTLLTAKAQIVQTLNLKDGSVMHGYIKSQIPGVSCTFHAEQATIALDGDKVRSIQTKKVAYNKLTEEWKRYADENNLAENQGELNISTIEADAFIENVMVLEKGRIVKYVELNHDYSFPWSEITSMESVTRGKGVLTGINHTVKLVNADGTTTIISGQRIKDIPNQKVYILQEDGMVVSVTMADIVKDNLTKNNPKQSLFEQSRLLDVVKMKDGTVFTGIITEQDYEKSPYLFMIAMKSDDIETMSSLRIDDVAEYGKLPNPDYVEVCEIRIDKGQIKVNDNDAKQLILKEEQRIFLIRPDMEKMNLKFENGGIDIVILANFKDEKDVANNYLIKTRKFGNDPKRANLNRFSYRDIFANSIEPNENENIGTTMRIVYHVSAKGIYVFFNSNTKKAIIINVE